MTTRCQDSIANLVERAQTQGMESMATPTLLTLSSAAVAIALAGCSPAVCPRVAPGRYVAVVSYHASSCDGTTGQTVTSIMTIADPSTGSVPAGSCVVMAASASPTRDNGWTQDACSTDGVVVDCDGVELTGTLGHSADGVTVTGTWLMPPERGGCWSEAVLTMSPAGG